MLPLRYWSAPLSSAMVIGILAGCADSPMASDTESDIPSPTLSLTSEQAFSQDLNGLSDRHLVLFKKEALPPDFYDAVSVLGGEVIFAHEIGIAAVAGLNDESAQTLALRKEVEAVIKDEPYFVDSQRGVTMASLRGIQSPADPTLAEGYPFQWNMTAIGAEEAWAQGKLGSEDVTVAIVDTGIDYLHPDLVGRVDLDRSGTVDWRGYPFGDDHTMIDQNFPGREYFSDLNGHGTHVASVVTSNAELVAGVGTRTKLMAVKVCNVYGVCFPSGTVNGLLFAIANGADVVNLSLGGWQIKKLMFPTGWVLGHFFKRAFTVANRAGVTVVAAAGNLSLDLDRNHRYALNLYCDMPNVLCVSATGPLEGGIPGPWTEIDTFAPYSNFGRGSLSVAAPGGTADMFGPGTGGWIWGACSTTTWELPECWDVPDAVAFIGTSQAAPHVSGVAALLVDELGRRPELIRARIRQGADDLGQPGKDDYYGMGRLNVCGALGCR